MKFLKITIISVVTVFFLASCGEDSPKADIENPVSYEFYRAGVSTVSFSGQTTRIAMATELINGLSDFSTSEGTLLEMYSNETLSGADANPYSEDALNASTKSVKSKVAASKDFFSSNTVEAAEIKSEIEAWIKAQVAEVFPNQNQLASAGSAGQIADGSSVRYVSSKGIEYNQVVNKSLIGALIVDQMLNNYLSTAVLDAGSNVTDNDDDVVADGRPYTTMEHKWDEAYGYLFGATGTDTSDPLATLGSDSFLNKYLSRVDGDSDFAGIASDIYEALKLGRAAIVAKDYEVRDEQVAILRDKISQVIAIRAVYYLQQSKLSIENNELGTAFHALSEGYGFIYSLRFLRQANSNNPYFTKAEVEDFLARLTAGNGFWDLSPETLDQLSNEIASKFDFTVEQAGS